MDDRPKQGFLSSIVRLVDGIVDDVQKLGHDAADLARQAAASSHKTGRIGSLLIGGGAVVFLGALLLCLMLVHLLVWLAPNLPMWASYAVIGFPVLGAGIGILAWAKRSRMQTLDPLREQSAKVVREVKETGEHVGQHIEAARESVHQTVESIRHTLDVREQIDRRPWAMVAGAVAAGWIGGTLVRDRSGSQPMPAGDAKQRPESGTLERLGQKFAPEFAHLKGLALGTLFGVVRDLASSSFPKPLEKDVGDVIDEFTVKFGGTPIHGHVLRESPNGHKSASVAGSAHD